MSADSNIDFDNDVEIKELEDTIYGKCYLLFLKSYIQSQFFF